MFLVADDRVGDRVDEQLSLTARADDLDQLRGSSHNVL
jgi:hypothetical protein